MPSTYSDLKVELIATGEQSGTWGSTTNTNLGTALGEAIAASADVAFSSGNVTVTLTDTNATQTARHFRLNCTGTTGGSTRELILGSGCQIEKPYLINNGCADGITVKNTTGTGITVPAGKTMLVYNNGTNVVDAVTHLSSLTLTTDLAVADGGTGLSSGTSGGVLAFTGAGTLASSGALTANALVIGGGAGAAPSTTTTGTGVLTFLGTPSSANLAAAVTDETGSGALVFATSPTLVTPALGTPSSGVVTNLTGTASININGTVGATTPNTGAFTTATLSSNLTLNGGTANGVLFLNGSKVASSGSALVFDGTNLGIGTSSPSGRLTVVNGVGAPAALFFCGSGTTQQEIAYFINSTNSGQLSIFGVGSSSVVPSWANGSIVSETVPSGSGNYILGAFTGNIVFQTNNRTTRAQISSDGTFRVAGAGSAGTTDAVQFSGSAPANAMKLDSSGNLLVGTTGLPSANGILSVSGHSRFYQSTADSSSAIFVDKSSATNTTSQVFVQFTISNQSIGSGQINANGASQAAFGSFSDARLKQNIVNLTSQLANIMALRPVEFDYIEKEGGGHQIGFIAQEMQEVYPDAIGMRAPDQMLTVTGWSKTEARLVKAIQEQQSIIESLAARIAALEAA